MLYRENTPPPCIRSTRLYSCILQNNFKLLGIFAARKMFWVDIVSLSLVKNLYFYTVMSTFVLHTLMCLKSIGRLFTVENLPWKKRNILLGPCLGADYMSRASPANRADSILSPLMGA